MKRGPSISREAQIMKTKRIKTTHYVVVPDDCQSNNTLLKAVTMGNVQYIKSCIVNPKDLTKLYPCKIEINDKTVINRNITLLHIAALNGHKKTAEALIFKGVDINIVGDNGVTPLFCLASTSKNEEMIEFLMNSGADINKPNNDGLTPLHQAVLKDNVRYIQLLINAGASINMVDIEGDTPLHCSAIAGSIRATKMLIRHGASLDDENKYGETPLFMSVSRGHTKVVLFLLNKGAKANTCDNREYSALQEAAPRYIDISLALIEKGANLFEKITKGFTPYILAALHNADLFILLHSVNDLKDKIVNFKSDSRKINKAKLRARYEIRDALFSRITCLMNREKKNRRRELYNKTIRDINAKL